jgi:hypothetical protein
MGGQWLRRGFLTLLTLFLLVALANLFGQAAATDTAGGGAGTLTVKAPSRVRGGLTYQGEFVIHATAALGAPTLVLDRGWVDQTTVNTVQPEPAGSTTDADPTGRLDPPDPRGGSGRRARSELNSRRPSIRSATGHSG